MVVSGVGSRKGWGAVREGWAPSECLLVRCEVEGWVEPGIMIRWGAWGGGCFSGGRAWGGGGGLRGVVGDGWVGGGRSFIKMEPNLVEMCDAEGWVESQGRG